ncbi:multidrug ABC transporter ATP-binding protein [Lentzea sp. NBRC 105346]|uniref:ABC transporter ATP-binding protein n=1 Tax=Lentzea sp. NBRC 105346 TaxID=3032205 RepID=UPI00249FAD44|nr:ABC transporter ATP-binding protein [Lentzea sp. NBRC 105346]GLZ34268.1 multidrug ABC transporter ATP-binding protein [Lentzea sp. NBRC 105346]
MSNFAILVDGLRVVRGGNEVVRGLTFSVPPGFVTGLIGPSGCGKTTLLRSIVGVQIIAAGSVSVTGSVGYSTQNPAVYADLTVRENLRYFAAVLEAPSSDVDRVLSDVDLVPQGDQLVGSLSGGQLARASLAVALLGSPQVLVLDEPTVELDPVLRRDLWQMFHSLAEEGRTVLVSSHVMDEAARCDRLLFMREGLLLADDTPAALRARTGSDDLEQAFLRLAVA